MSENEKTYDPTNKGALFRNMRKDEDWKPELTGSINVDGQEYWLNAWPRTSQNGTKYLSIQVKAKGTSARKTTEKEDEDIGFSF